MTEICGWRSIADPDSASYKERTYLTSTIEVGGLQIDRLLIRIRRNRQDSLFTIRGLAYDGKVVKHTDPKSTVYRLLGKRYMSFTLDMTSLLD